MQSVTKGDKPFSYTDALIATGLGAVTQGRGIVAQEVINIGGAYLGSTIKGESPVGPMVGAGLGTAAGALGGWGISYKLAPTASQTVSEAAGAIGGSIINEATGSAIQQQMSKKDDF